MTRHLPSILGLIAAGVIAGAMLAAIDGEPGPDPVPRSAVAAVPAVHYVVRNDGSLDVE